MLDRLLLEKLTYVNDFILTINSNLIHTFTSRLKLLGSLKDVLKSFMTLTG